MPNGLVTRAAITFIPSSLRKDDRSVEFILSTEEAANVWSWERWDVIREVLVAAGVKIPGNKQIPLQDSHDRSSVKKTLGSVREIRVENDQVVGRLFFARSPEAVEAFEKIEDGHLDSGSVGYSADDFIWIDEGQSFAFNGKAYTGPVQLTTGWSLKEYSLVAIGADPNAKAREATETVKTSREAVENLKETNTMLDNQTNVDKQPHIDTEAITRAAVEAERLRVTAINSLCKKHSLEDLAGNLIESGSTIERAQAAVLDEIAKRQKPLAQATAATIVVGETDDQKFRAAAVDGLLIRSGRSVSKPAAGFQEFRGKSLLRLAEMCLQRAGIDTRNMSSSEIASAALRRRGAYDIVGSSADFTSIVLDASNKSLQMGYENPEHIWRYIARKGSAPNFKNINRIQIFEAPDLVAINENGSYTEAIFKDGKETYALTSKGLRFTISRVAIINDDTDAFGRVPFLLGDTASRTIEKSLLGLVTGGLSTTVMSDGKALFHADHKNISTGKALDSDALALDVGVMMAQVGRGADGSSVPAFAYPKYSLVPVALKLTNDVICSSASIADAEMSSGVDNPFKKMGIVPLASPYLTLADEKRRYLLADPYRNDSLEVSFLDGVETPMLEEVDQTDADGRVFKVRLDVGAGVLDWRGLVTNAGQ